MSGARFCLAALGLALAPTAMGVGVADYARAQRFLSWNADRWVRNGEIRVQWNGSLLRYSRNNRRGEKECVIVDVANAARPEVLGEAACNDTAEPEGVAGEVLSPDRRWAVFVADHNLWIRALQDDKRFPLTQDGTEHHDYASSPGHPVGDARSAKPIAPLVLWSPDSRYVLTHQLDRRAVK